MTNEELSQLYYLNRDIEQHEKHKQELIDQIHNIGQTSDVVKASATAYPYTQHSVSVTGVGINDKSKALKLQAELVDTKKIIELKTEQCILEYNRLMRYIVDVDDSLTRQILMHRYVDGLTWRQVAEHIGGGNTEEGVKKICYRFLAKK